MPDREGNLRLTGYKVINSGGEMGKRVGMG